MSAYLHKSILDYFISYAKKRGLNKATAKGATGLLQHFFERASPSDPIERVFDRVIKQFAAPAPPAPPPDPHKPEFKEGYDKPGRVAVEAVDVYELVRAKVGWASDEEIKAHAALQATEIKPSEGFLDWLEGAFKRYFKELEESDPESINKGRTNRATYRQIENFLDRFLHAGEMWSGEGQEKPVVAAMEESLHVCVCHATEPHDRYVEKVYDPSTQFAVDLHMRTSFTNRLRGIDWDYFLQAD